MGPSYSGPIIADDLVFTTETKDKATEVVTLDGAEQLGLGERLRFRHGIRRAAGVIVTSHRPLPWLPTLSRHRVDPELFADWVEHLTSSEGFPCPWSRSQLIVLLARHNNNARDAFRDLFDQAPQMLDAVSASLGGSNGAGSLV